MITPTEPLATAIAARVEAGTRLDKAADALGRARKTHDAAQAEVDRLAAEESKWVARHKARLETWVLSGNAGAPPAAVADEGSIVAKRSAEMTRDAATQMLSSVERAYSEAAEAHAVAERAEREAKDVVYRAEVDAIAKRIEERRAAERADCALIAVIKRAQPHLVTADAARVLDQPVDRPTSDSIFGVPGAVPDMFSRIAAAPVGLDEARRFWSEFDARLDAPPTVAAPAERAA
jgi:hypothetical protein